MSAERPLVVDLDGALVLGETSLQSAAEALARSPWEAGRGLAALGLGRAAAKRRFAARACPDPKRLRFRRALVVWLEGQAQAGRALHLVTGADQAVASAVAAHFGWFSSARGSDGLVNLKGRLKLAWLDARFPGGFDYAGDARADRVIWRAQRRAILVGPAAAFSEALQREGVAILATF